MYIFIEKLWYLSSFFKPLPPLMIEIIIHLEKKRSQNGSTPGAVSWYVTQLHPHPIYTADSSNHWSLLPNIHQSLLLSPSNIHTLQKPPIQKCTAKDVGWWEQTRWWLDGWVTYVTMLLTYPSSDWCLVGTIPQWWLESAVWIGCHLWHYFCATLVELYI